MTPSVNQQPPLLSQASPTDLAKLRVYLPVLKLVSLLGPGQQGGVSRSLEPLVQQLGAQVHWIALTGLPKNVESKGFNFHEARIPSMQTEQLKRFANEYLFPLFHELPEKAVFDQESYRAFRQVNEQIAAQTLRISAESFPTICWLHDYHLALAAPLLSQDAGVVPCQFWHIPWPSPEALSGSPVIVDILEAMLNNKLIGFQTSNYAQNFLLSAQKFLPDCRVNFANMQIEYKKRQIQVVTMPLGVDFNHWQDLAQANHLQASALSKKHKLASQVILGIDRLDYTKGVFEKLQALELFIEQNPQWRRRFHYVQLAQQPLSGLSSFNAYAKQTREKVEQINSRFTLDGWEPIIYQEGHLGQNELASWYQACDVLVVSPTCDGLNLIAKEFVACRTDEQGALILSKQAGSSAELSIGALTVDGTKPDTIASAISEALSLSAEEKRRRMVAMRHVVGWNQLHDWAIAFLSQATQLDRRTA